MTKKQSPTLKKVREYAIALLTDLYESLEEVDKLKFREIYNCGIESLPDEKIKNAIIQCERFHEKIIEEIRELPAQEFHKIGFLAYDYLSSCKIEGGKGVLWVFNHGNYSKVRRNLSQFVCNDDVNMEIEDWLIDIFKDHGLKIEPTITSIVSEDAHTSGCIVLIDYSENEIGSECIKIEFTY